MESNLHEWLAGEKDGLVILMPRKYQVAEYTGDCSSVDVSVGLGGVFA
jgi:hypothetical protein